MAAKKKKKAKTARKAKTKKKGKAKKGKTRSRGRPASYRSVGRPRANIDVVLACKLAQLGHTDEGIAALMDVHKDTFLHRKTLDPKFSGALDKAREVMKQSIQRCLFERMLEGNSAVAMYLGRVKCGWTEPKTVVVEGSIEHDHKHQLEDRREKMKQLAANPEARKAIRLLHGQVIDAEGKLR